MVTSMTMLSYRKIACTTSWTSSRLLLRYRRLLLVLDLKVFSLTSGLKVVTHFGDQGAQVHITALTTNYRSNIAPIVRLVIFTLRYYLDKVLDLCLIKQIVVVMENLLTELLIDIACVLWSVNASAVSTTLDRSIATLK